MNIILTRPATLTYILFAIKIISPHKKILGRKWNADNDRK
jgi:hypothetical protein